MFSDYLKTFPQFIIPKQALTTFAGMLANHTNPFVKNRLIRHFIKRFNVDMTEAIKEHPEDYASFNDFFIRHLKPECRPLASAEVISPVDGFVSEFGRISQGRLLQAKGWFYTVEELLASSKETTSQFNSGVFSTLYLSPKDYHRVHMPIAAKLLNMVYVPGKLFSVQPATTRVIPKLFARNERLVVFFETALGLMAMVLVGATIVGGISTSWHGDMVRGHRQATWSYPQAGENQIELAKGEEMGYFKLGSTVILLFANHTTLDWPTNLNTGDKINYGQALLHRKPF